MNKIKSIWTGKLALIMAMAFTATACQQDDIIEQYNPKPQGEYISFNIQRGWDYDQISRSAESEYGDHVSGHILASEDQSQSMGMKTYQQGINTWFDDTNSRGTMITQSSFKSFRVYAYKSDGSALSSMFVSEHRKDDANGWNYMPTNTNGEGYYWPGANYTCSFYGIALSDGKTNYEEVLSNVKTNAEQVVSFDYTVPNNATDQPDIMVAAARGVNGAGEDGANLNFKHILTAVNIKVGETMQNGTIESITFKNIFSKGTYSFETGIWSGLREFNELHDYTVNLGSGFSTSTTTEAKTQINGTNATFMVIPQTLSANAEIEIMFKHAGAEEAISIKGSLAGSSWPQGKIINYLINVKENGDLIFTSNVIPQDAHYVIVPLTIKANNLSKGWTIESDNPAVTLKSELSTLQQQGYWTANELGSQSLSKTSSGNEITVYAFLEENLTEENRNFTLSLKNTATGAIVDTKTITQLCMSSVRSERIEETSYVPWGFKWDRKVTMQVIPGLSFDLVRLFGAVLFESTANDIIEQYGAEDYVTVEVGGRIFGMSYNTKVTIDYSKIPQLNGAFDASDGHSNTSYLYNYKGVSAVSQIETYLRGEAETNNYNFTETPSGDNDGESIEYFAAKSCAMKNKYYAETVTKETDSGTVTYPVAVLSSDETSNTTDNFNYLNWYLPAKDEYSAIEEVESNTNYQLNGGYWTSTAVDNDNVNAYMYTSGGTGIGTDDRMKTHLVRCKRK